ncbi:PPOX class F420-dependent oxidoreductase [Streptomyces sp. HNM0574]|uniref:PPOX class F420-dependent oxidoreductase n=1 Tax=Streptomyces sp. HNM0574 TaxID=2714954 RepID=UPI00146F78FA|nr:PPOX class F420-dependent oxidoreductase [Streptomyces sp. HNM0574]NLU68176.1 PPOX class F420-dependent oxidoreductase [Streptomyces sp. HNM0574]
MVPPEISRSRYVSLVTHRRDGTPRATPVWAAEDGGELIVWTREDSWKVKRLRRDPRVTVTPCDARGRTAPDAAPVAGTARLLERPGELARVRRALARSYGWQFRLLDSGGALFRRGRRPHVGIAVTF